jgi:hypothetical protein
MRAWEGGSFNPEQIEVMKSALDEAWEALSKDQRARWTPAELAKRIIKLARRGELDPARLRMFATTEIVSNQPAPFTTIDTPGDSAPSAAARITIHRRNIDRYQRLLQTNLSAVERNFVDKRIAEEEAEILRVGADQHILPAADATDIPGASSG